MSQRNVFVTPSFREGMLEIHQKVKNISVDDPKTQQERKPHRFLNIFASPIEFVTGFLPPNFNKSDEEREFINKSIENNFIFAGLESDELVTLVNAMEKRVVPEKEAIIKQGDIGDYFYLIQSGSVKFVIDGKDCGEVTSGAAFGELALLYDSPRAATCIASTECSLWRVHQNTFRKILAGKQMKNTDEIRGILRSVPFLANLDTTFLNKMVDSLHTMTFQKDELIIRKGDEGKVFYILKSGAVKVHDIAIGQSKYDDQILTRGDYFGERAIVTLEPRAANITALEKCEAYCLTRQTFNEHLGDLEDLVKRSSDLRCLVSCPIFSNGKIEPFEANALVKLVRDITIPEGTVLFEKSKVKFLYDEEGAFCFLRSGEVTITTGDTSRVITAGEYFGVSTIVATEEEPFSAKVTQTASIGVLSKSKIVSVVKDTQRLVSSKSISERIYSYLDSSIKFKDLKKHRLLGCGTFGKVWLVSDKSQLQKRPYALKVQKKKEIINFKQVKGIMREKSIMAMLNHPFVIKLITTYQDKDDLYMLLPLVQGGELFSLLHQVKNGRVPENDAQFYASAVLEGLSYMHKRNILYRDLKPENILLDSEGYPIIVDMGFAKAVIDKTYTLCGTPLYIAPEVIMNRGHNMGADQWSWAVLLYEMIHGSCPFYKDGMDQMALFKAIIRVNYSFPKNGLMSKSCEDIISSILKPNPKNRLGLKNKGDDDIKNHAWFANYDFESLVEKKVESPWKPTIKDAFDVSAFENWDHLEEKILGSISSKEQMQFEAFGEYI